MAFAIASLALTGLYAAASAKADGIRKSKRRLDATLNPNIHTPQHALDEALSHGHRVNAALHSRKTKSFVKYTGGTVLAGSVRGPRIRHH